MNFLRKIVKLFFGEKINNTRIFPITTKIVFIFAIFIIISNLSSNYINMIYNRGELTKLMKELLIKDMKDIYGQFNTQYEIYQLNKDIKATKKLIRDKLVGDFKQKKAVVLGVCPAGQVFFHGTKIKNVNQKYNSSNLLNNCDNKELIEKIKIKKFEDQETLVKIIKLKEVGVVQEKIVDKKKVKQRLKKYEGFIPFQFNNEAYYGLYKYNPKWNIYIIRGEELNEFYSESRAIFWNIAIIIAIISILATIIGIHLLRFILRFLRVITSSII